MGGAGVRAVLGGVVVRSGRHVVDRPRCCSSGCRRSTACGRRSFFAVTQHIGLREDVLDRLTDTCTVYMNPVLRFLYLNMNYHLEHHLFPTRAVPRPPLRCTVEAPHHLPRG